MKDITSPRAGERNEYSAIFLMTNAARRLGHLALWFSLTMVSVALPSSIFAEERDAPPSVNIKEIMTKARSGQPLTQEERRTLREWRKSVGLPPSVFGEESDTPPDVNIREIMRSGQRPTQEERRALVERARSLSQHLKRTVRPLTGLQGSVRLSWSSGGKNSFEKRADCTHVDEDEHDSFDSPVTLDESTVGENRNPIGQVTRAYSGGSFTVTGREYYHYKYTTHCRGPEWEQTQENDGESRDQGGGNLGARGELSQCWAVLNEKTGIAQLFCRLLTERRSRGVGDKEENVPWKTSFLIPGDPKDGWGSVGSVYSKSERDGDTIRFGGSFDLPTEGPWMGSHGRAAAANGLGKGLNGPDWKPAPEFEVLSSQISQLSQPYPAPRREKSKESPEYGFRGPWPGNLHVEWDVRTNPVEAIVADSFEAKRGEKLEIDGSKSKGENLRYQWTFAPRCQKDSATPNPGAKKTERAINPVFLCDTDVTLEVTDGKAKDKKITHVKIVPRPGWKTDFRGDIADGSLAMSPLTATNAPFLAALGTN